MTEKLTRITLPGARGGEGLMDWGERTAEDMIGQLRAHAARLREQAERIEAAADEHFQIDVVRGVHVARHVRTIQQSTIAQSRPVNPLAHQTEGLNSLERV